jgi:Transglycosylase SLT domain
VRALLVAAALASLVIGVAVGAAAERDDDVAGRAPAPAATETPAPAGGDESPALPDPDAPLPRDATKLAAALASTTEALDVAIDRWRAEGDPAQGEPPADVELLAHDQQRIYRRLGERSKLARGVLVAVPGALRAEVRDNVIARRELSEITSVHRGPPPKIRIGPAEPADLLQRHYRAAHRRFRVRTQLLAAVNFVESAFGRLRNRSVAGARGPMQFMPATWRAYGLGGDIHDPRDAILGAANYLRASGAPRDERGALYRYNPSPHYVEAILRYTRRIAADPRAFYGYYAWQVYVNGRRVTSLP